MERCDIRRGTRVVLNHGILAQAEGKRLRQSYYPHGAARGPEIWGDDFFQIGLEGEVTRVNQRTCSVTFPDGRILRQCEFWALDEENGQDSYIPTEGRISWPSFRK